MVPFAGLLAALEQIPDPRRRQGRRYPLAHLLLFSVLAVLAGATSYRGILVFITVHRERLNAVFGTTLRRAPAVNTLRALFQALDPAALETAFRHHARELSDAAARPGPRVIALDGKTLKRSFDHLNDKAAAHVLSAFACEAALILAHQEVGGAPEEIPAAQTLIESLGVCGVLCSPPMPCTGRKNVHQRGAYRQRPSGPGQGQPAEPARCRRELVRRAGSPRSARDGRPPPSWSRGASSGRDIRGHRPASSRMAGNSCLRGPDHAPFLVQGHPHRSVAGPPRGRLLRQPDRADGGRTRSGARSAPTGGSGTGRITCGTASWVRTPAGSGAIPASSLGSARSRSTSCAPMASPM